MKVCYECSIFILTASNRTIKVVLRVAWRAGIGDPVKVWLQDECGTSKYKRFGSRSSILSILPQKWYCALLEQDQNCVYRILYAAPGDQCDQSDMMHKVDPQLVSCRQSLLPYSNQDTSYYCTMAFFHRLFKNKRNHLFYNLKLI